MITVRSAFQKLSKMNKEWLTNVGEDPHKRNATLDTGRNLKQILAWCWFVPCVFS